MDGSSKDVTSVLVNILQGYPDGRANRYLKHVAVASDAMERRGR